MAAPPRVNWNCRGTCAYCDARSGDHRRGWGATSFPDGCTWTESELVYRRREGRPSVYLIVSGDGRIAIGSSYREPNPWSPAALLRAAFADRWRGIEG